MDKLRREVFGLIEKGSRFISPSLSLTWRCFCSFVILLVIGVLRWEMIFAYRRENSVEFNSFRRQHHAVAHSIRPVDRQRPTPKAHAHTATRTSAHSTHRLKNNYIIDLFCHSSLVCLLFFLAISLSLFHSISRSHSIIFCLRSRSTGSIICLCCRKFNGARASVDLSGRQ